MTDYNQLLGMAIDNASRNLPDGWIIRLDIEKDGNSLELIYDDEPIDYPYVGTELIDDIGDLVEIAQERARMGNN